MASAGRVAAEEEVLFALGLGLVGAEFDLLAVDGREVTLASGHPPAAGFASHTVVISELLCFETVLTWCGCAFWGKESRGRSDGRKPRKQAI